MSVFFFCVLSLVKILKKKRRKKKQTNKEQYQTEEALTRLFHIY